MRYSIRYLDTAEYGLLKLRKSGDKQALKKLEVLIEELKVHPRAGTGRPEQLRYQTTERWSRRISEKHRLIYDIFEHTVTVEIIQVYGHYDDK
ncbi:MAG: Txe/YoeB family addiction module toxin [Bacteroidales bacterium]|nr:Txe/YoeB family addiction module toxin [Bacteroidales bacterium]